MAVSAEVVLKTGEFEPGDGTRYVFVFARLPYSPFLIRMGKPPREYPTVLFGLGVGDRPLTLHAFDADFNGYWPSYTDELRTGMRSEMVTPLVAYRVLCALAGWPDPVEAGHIHDTELLGMSFDRWRKDWRAQLADITTITG